MYIIDTIDLCISFLFELLIILARSAQAAGVE